MEGTPFGRYRLVELLGRGGMGEVWHTYDTDTDRVVALKVLPPHLAQDSGFSERFRREAHAAARLNNPHIIPIHHYGEIDGRLYVDMRLIEGRDLQTVLAAGPIDPARAVRIIEQVAKALHAAHKVGLVHRDVKPSNILLDEDDFAYLIDFGIARAADETRLTSTGHAIGTFSYMAPERLGERPDEDARADIYALACVLYECLTGRPPFSGASVGSLIAAHLNTPPPRPSTSQPNVPAQFDQVIATGMAKDPDNRYATTVELANAAHDAITTPLAPPSKPTLPAGGPAGPPPRPAGRPPAPPLGPPAGSPGPPPGPPPGPTAVRQQPADLNLAATQQRAPGWPPVPQTRPADRPPPYVGTPQPQPWRRQPRRVKLGLIAAVIVILAGGIVGYLVWPHPPPPQSQTAQSAPPSGQTTAPSGQTVLPFTDLSSPDGVAVDSTGTVYVTDSNRVVVLPKGSSTQTELRFTDLSGKFLPGFGPTFLDVAVDSTGTVYATDYGGNQVVAWAKGSTTNTELPFTSLWRPRGVVVDSTGTVYVGDDHRVVALAKGATSQTELPFTGLSDPLGVTVDSTDTVYVTDSVGTVNVDFHYRVVTLAKGSSTQTELPLTVTPGGVAVDNTGTVYATDVYMNRVVALAKGSTTQTELPFTGLSSPQGVAVDSTGTVYVVDKDNKRVVALRPR